MSKGKERKQKNIFHKCIAGCGVSLCIYLCLQLFVAMLLQKEVIGLEAIETAQGAAAAISVLCGSLSVAKGEWERRAMISAAVLAAFLLVITLVPLVAGKSPWKSAAGAEVMTGGMIGALVTSFVRGKKEKYRRKNKKTSGKVIR